MITLTITIEQRGDETSLIVKSPPAGESCTAAEVVLSELVNHVIKATLLGKDLNGKIIREGNIVREGA